jgi:hypothetical protein
MVGTPGRGTAPALSVHDTTPGGDSRLVSIGGTVCLNWTRTGLWGGPVAGKTSLFNDKWPAVPELLRPAFDGSQLDAQFADSRRHQGDFHCGVAPRGRTGY